MTNIKNEILNWIGNKTVTTDELHDFIKSQLSDIYEIGDAGVIINEMVADELLIANDFEVKKNPSYALTVNTLTKSPAKDIMQTAY